MTLDIKDFYYGTAMDQYKYMKLALACILDEIIDQYSLRTLSSDGWVYLDIRKVMPGLKQAGRIANELLKAHLAHFGFAPVPRTPELWKHATKPIIFALVVDDFGVNYIGKGRKGLAWWRASRAPGFWAQGQSRNGRGEL